MSNELKNLVRIIRLKGNKTIQQISDEIGYSRAYFNNQINIGGNDRLFAILKEKYSTIIEQDVPRETNISIAPANPRREDPAGAGNGEADLIRARMEEIMMLREVVERRLTELMANLGIALKRSPDPGPPAGHPDQSLAAGRVSSPYREDEMRKIIEQTVKDLVEAQSKGNKPGAGNARSRKA